MTAALPGISRAMQTDDARSAADTAADRQEPPAVRPAERRLAARLVLAALAAAVVALPFAVLLLLVEGRSESLERLDTGVADTLNEWALRSDGAVLAFEVVDVVLHPMVFRVAVAVLCVVLWRLGARRLALWAGVTMAAGSLLGPLVKVVVARARPTFEDPVSSAAGYSFPSGHALNSMLACAILLLVALPAIPAARRPLAWLLAVAVVLLTGLDRLALGVHYVSDVVAGWSVALAVVVATSAALGREEQDSN